MAGIASLTARLDDLIALFNRKGMDVPDGLFDRHTRFELNGESFEALIGRASPDPLVLMLTRGAAGYRFVTKGLQHALPDARVERGDVEDAGEAGAGPVTTRLWLSGHTRGTGEVVHTLVDIVVTMGESGSVAVASATVDPAALAAIREARLRT